MRNHLRTRTATLTVVVIGLLAFGTAAASAQAKQRTLRLTATRIDTAFLDLGTTGLSLGDGVVFSDTLTRRGRDAGEDGGRCTVTHVTGADTATSNCDVTLALSRGQITVQGLVGFQGLTTVPDTTVAVTGGTGAYRGASGELDFHQVSPTVSTYTVHLDSRSKRRR